MDLNEKTNVPKKNLTDADFYEQACAYFYYHAGQRTTMINYFIAVFGALLTMYGALISSYSIACMLIAVFMGIVSVLFYLIDVRNKFDVKKSENVIRQIEHDYEMDVPRGNYPYGVFSNESHIFDYYDRNERKKRKKEYKELCRLQKQVARGVAESSLLDQKVEEFIGDNRTVSAHEILQCLNQPTIVHLSSSIRLLYWLCATISVFAFGFALFLTIIA